MEAGPRDTSQQQGDPGTFPPDGPDDDPTGGPADAGGLTDGDGAPRLPGGTAVDPAGPPPLTGEDPGSPDGEELPGAPGASGESFRDLRPPRRFRIWQIAPIVGLAILGSLMFAFPLAFEFGDGGAVVAMLGLLLSCCAAGWGLMAARRVGYTWPGLPPRGSGRRPDWRFVALYVAVVAVLAALAIWRVARLR
ncbi:hypothetical protein IHE55_22325 [Streptomyces pactum]|uniref:Transmembrane protein n=1 Tax=Streptomyces pactum TaxID=68249 RepID=A0ABS0NQ74_9ACTN|nr:hypothetical protein [Streptomyces pactum]MBH5337345.1 hypothetical protein [Streptomyces pactum]